MRVRITIRGRKIYSKDPPKYKVLIRDEEQQILLARVVETRSNHKRKGEVVGDLSNR